MKHVVLRRTNLESTNMTENGQDERNSAKSEEKKDVTRTYLKSDVCYLGVIIKMYVQAGSLRLHMSSNVLLLLLMKLDK